eukprot:COSAG05_NODE_798_length_7245_cov_46.630982_5_plen_66_part_00
MDKGSVGRSVSPHHPSIMDIEDGDVLRGMRSLARQQTKELAIREVRICTGTISIVAVDLVVTRCH